MSNEVDEFLKNLNGEESDPFVDKQTDPFAEKPAPKVEEEESDESEDDKPLPFHKDPKLQRFIEKQVNKRVAEIKPAASETEKFLKETTTPDEMDEVLTRIIGNDTAEKKQAVKDLKNVLTGLEERGARRALEQLERDRAQAVEADKEAEAELTQGFEDIEETFDVDISSNAPQAVKTRNEFIDFVRKIAPKDEEGAVIKFPDLPQAFELYKSMKKTAPASTARAKELASRTMVRSGDGTAAPKTTGQSWSDVERIFSKISK